MSSLEKDKENFALKHQIYKLKKAQSAGSDAATNKSNGAKPSHGKEKEVKVGRPEESEVATDDDAMSKEILGLHLEKDDLLRRISDLETSLVEHKEAASRYHDDHHVKGVEEKTVLSAIHIEEARKKERKAFQTLAAHDAALLKKFEVKMASLSRQRESMKSIIDELSNKCVLYLEYVQDKEKLLKENNSEKDLLRSELQTLRDRNQDLVENLRLAAESKQSEVEGVDAIRNSDDNDGSDKDGSVANADAASSGISDLDTVRTADSIPSALSREGEERGGGGPVNSTMLLLTPGTIRDAGVLTTGEGADTVDDDDKEKEGAGGISPPQMASDISRISVRGLHMTMADLRGESGGDEGDGDGVIATAGYNEETAALHESIRAIVAGKESETIEQLRAALQEKEELMLEKERSFDHVITRARETTLLEAEEIARLERELEESRIEVRSLSRASRVKDHELTQMREDKSLLEDMLLENEASAVNKAMEVLNSQSPAAAHLALARKGSSQRNSPGPAGAAPPNAEGGGAGGAAMTTPGGLSTQDMADLLHAQAQAAEALALGQDREGQVPGQGQAQGRGEEKKKTRLRIDTSSDRLFGGVGAGVDSNRVSRSPGVASSAESVELLLMKEKEKEKEKEEELLKHRRREAQLMNALEGVLDKYLALERRLNFDNDNKRRGIGMKF